MTNTRQHIIGIVAALAILLAVVQLWRGRTSSSERIQAGFALELGAVLAQETAQLLNNQGSAVVVTRHSSPANPLSARPRNQ